MRKTNKKLSKLVDDKSGVILVTVIFIVAMALIFITTALTITIANRQRIYTNAKSDQARLTVTSLSQALWQAIYSQQISDDMLYDLAKGSTGNGSLVTFECSDIPGMGTASSGTSATAYFYLIQEENLSADPQVLRKIGIECKCDIEGNVQYYRMILEKHQSEGLPATWFNVGLNLGDGGSFNSCVIGFDVNHYPTTSDEPAYFVSWRPANPADDDNIAVVHHPTYNGRDKMGFYSTVITDGVLSFRDSVFARDVFFLGEDAGFSLDVNQSTAAVYNTVGGEFSSSGGTPQYGNFYFWGTNSPFYDEDVISYWPREANLVEHTGNITFSFRGVNGMYFDYSSDASHPGFTGSSIGTFTQQAYDNDTSNTLRSSIQELHIESGISYGNASGFGSRVTPESEGWNSIAAANNSYLTPGSGETDTIDELYDSPDGMFHGKLPAEESEHDLSYYCVPNGNAAVNTMTTGVYRFSSNASVTIPANNTCCMDVSGGDIIIFFDANVVLNMNTHSYIQITGSGDGRVIFLLEDNARIVMNSYSGIYDKQCFKTFDDSAPESSLNVPNLNQTKCPRCYIFSLYTGCGGDQSPVYFNQNEYRVLTANLGFYPQSDPSDSGACHFSFNDPGLDDVYYGRISAGGIDNDSGHFFYIPYCPSPPGATPDRDTAYRDNTDYSVVQGESGYFTV